MAATEEARRPRTRPSASTTYHVRWMSVTFGENVRTRPIFRFRVVSEPFPRTWVPGPGSGPAGGPTGRPTRIGRLSRGGKPRRAHSRPGGSPPLPGRLVQAGPRPAAGPPDTPTLAGGSAGSAGP